MLFIFPILYFGPCKSTIIERGIFNLISTSLIKSITFPWILWLPWLKFRRKTLTPFFARDNIKSSEFDAGPIVAMILVERLII